MVTLNNTPIYATYEIKNPSTKKSGTFYVYNEIEKNNRVKITDDINKIGKPVSATGWVNLSDIQ